MESALSDNKYGEYAEKSLMAFSRFVRELPMASHSYLISLYAYLKGIFKVETQTYFEDMLKAFRPFKFVIKNDIQGLVVCEGKVCKKYSSIDDLGI